MTEGGRPRRGMDHEAPSLLSATGVLLAAVLWRTVAVSLTGSGKHRFLEGIRRKCVFRQEYIPLYRTV